MMRATPWTLYKHYDNILSYYDGTAHSVILRYVTSYLLLSVPLTTAINNPSAIITVWKGDGFTFYL